MMLFGAVGMHNSVHNSDQSSQGSSSIDAQSIGAVDVTAATQVINMSGASHGSAEGSVVPNLSSIPDASDFVSANVTVDSTSSAQVPSLNNTVVALRGMNTTTAISRDAATVHDHHISSESSISSGSDDGPSIDENTRSRLGYLRLRFSALNITVLECIHTRMIACFPDLNTQVSAEDDSSEVSIVPVLYQINQILRRLNEEQLNTVDEIINIALNASGDDI